MCQYTVLKRMESNGTLKEAIKQGVVSTTMLSRKTIYEYFLSVLSKYDRKIDAVGDTANRYNVSESNIHKIIYDFGC